MNYYDIAKDFAGPLAAVAAAVAASVVTWVFQSRQVQVAQTQAQTARYKLKFDLFEERHKLYGLLEEYIGAVASTTDFSDAQRVEELGEQRRRLTPIRWMFGPEVWNWVIGDLQNKKIVHLMHLTLEARDSRDPAKLIAASSGRAKFSQEAAEDTEKLFARYLRLDF